MKATAATEKILMIDDCSMLISPSAADSWKLIEAATAWLCEIRLSASRDSERRCALALGALSMRSSMPTKAKMRARPARLCSMRPLAIWARPSLVISFSKPTVLRPENTRPATCSTRSALRARMSEARSITASIR